jgi:DNA-binding NtrC family response regulator
MRTESPEQAGAVRILLVEDEADMRTTLRYNLKRCGYAVLEAGNGQEALEVLGGLEPSGGVPAVDVVICDVMMPVMDGLTFTRALRERRGYAETAVVFLTAKGEPADRHQGYRAGADDYVTKPFDLEELLFKVKAQARRSLVVRQLRGPGAPGQGEGSGAPGLAGELLSKVAEWERRFPQLAAVRRDSIVGSSPRTLALLREVLLRAPGRDPVLIVGETGTGKTGVAEALWRLGPRAQMPFRVVNCAELASSDAAITLGKLFGYGKGSGLSNVPREGQTGLLEDVDGGTLFLDEVHQLPLAAQAMLLLPVEGRAFNPAVGKGPPRRVDVKFVLASNLDLRVESVSGRFPSDLYQRLAASQIRVPSLGDRREDIPALAHHFLEEAKGELGILEASFSLPLLQHLVTREWPGNVRELRGVVREAARRAAFELDSVLTVAHLPEAPAEPCPGPVAPGPTADRGAPPETDAAPVDAGPWNEVELPELTALRRHRFKVAAAEQDLGLSNKSRTLTNHLRGMCFKALCLSGFDVRAAARLVVGREDEALLDRMVERVESYLEVVREHVAAHTTEMLFKSLPRDYRKHVEQAVARARAA